MHLLQINFRVKLFCVGPNRQAICTKKVRKVARNNTSAIVEFCIITCLQENVVEVKDVSKIIQSFGGA